MADALSAAAEGRHVLLWSANPETEAAWRGAGVSGQLQPSSLMADIINRGGNKLDQYLSENVVAPAHAHGSADRREPDHDVRQPDAAGAVPLHRRARTRASAPIYGEYVGIATVNLPGYARDISSPSNSSVVTSGPEGPTLLEGANLDILPGGDPEHHVQLRAARGPRLHDRGAERTDPAAPPGTSADPPASTTFQDDSAPHTISW